MGLNYSQGAITQRLNGVITAIDDSGAGILVIQNSANQALCSITLSNPCGTASGGVLTFSAATQPSAAMSGTATQAIITDGAGNPMVSGLTVGIPLSTANIIVNNGLNSTVITAGQTVELVSGQIIGS